MHVPRSVSLSIACLAGSVMSFELSLMRLFSFITWYHFASMVISVALLGFGASGVLLRLRPGLGRPPRQRAALYAGIFALTSLVAVFAVSRLTFDLLAITRDGGALLRLLLNYLALLVPFTSAGLAIVTLLAGYPGRSGRLYGFDLLGAALGTVAMVLLTARIGVEGVTLLAAAIAAASAWLLAWPGRGERAGASWGWAAVALLIALLIPWAPRIFDVRASPGKAHYRYLAGSEEVVSLFRHWSALFRTDVLAGGPPVPWIVNPAFPVPLPEQHQILIDGDSMTPLVRLRGTDPESLAFLDYMLPSLAYQALAPERVLVIGSGGGVDVLAALHHGARKVDAVEVNSDIVHLVSEVFADWNDGLFRRDDVRLHLDEGRSFVRRSAERYDHIQLSLVDTWASSAAGAYSLAEGYLYTVEAFEDYLHHLSDRGVISLSRWLNTPPRETLRVVTVAAEALRRLGVEHPERHILVAWNGRVSNTVIRRSAFRDADIQAFLDVAERRSFSFLYLPGSTPPGAARVFADFLHTEDRERFYDDYEFDVTPTTDDRPFFFQFLRWREMDALRFSGKGLLLIISVQALVLSFALLALPLLWRQRVERQRAERQRAERQGSERESASDGGVLVYFLLLGIAFMLVEIVLMQRFTLYLGHPIYSIALVLTVLLLGAGAGSLSAARLVPPGRRPEGLFGALIVLIAAYAFLLSPIFHATLGWALAARLLIATLLILPIAFLLGIPFPAALERLQKDGTAKIGWAWAANGCGSVLGPLLAVILALDLGYGRVLLIAALLYAGAYLVFRGRWNAVAA